jgi:hypothetical protein
LYALRNRSSILHTAATDQCARSCSHYHYAVRTSENYKYRLGLYDDTGVLLDEITHLSVIDASCEFTQQMLPALVKAVAVRIAAGVE